MKKKKKKNDRFCDLKKRSGVGRMRYVGEKKCKEKTK